MLTLVPTPLGNLEDLTFRALKILKEADLILCEDTRQTRKLLSAYQISTRMERHLEHNPKDLDKAMELLSQGKKIALVCDSGTPGISDPGARLVARARKEKIPVTVLPGPCAAVCALAGSGLPTDSFVFLGFLPRSQGKQKKIVQRAASLGKTILIYESPYRIKKLVLTLQECLGPETPAALAREMTKIHEEWICGTLSGIQEALSQKERILGEIVLVVHPQNESQNL